MEPYEKFVKNHETILVKLSFTLIAEVAAGSACWLKYSKIKFLCSMFFYPKNYVFLYSNIYLYLLKI